MSSPTRPGRAIPARLEAVLRRAEDLAGAWSARAVASTTPARERAILRLLGVGGLDRNDIPLASAVVEQHVRASRERLAAGLALPFAVALLEYEVTPMRLAQDVASGAVDLAFESELLQRPDRRAAAEAEVRRLAQLALERIAANRVARLDLLDVLGDAPRPWLGAHLADTSLATAGEAAAQLVASGADLVRVRVPAIRELVLRLHDFGREPSYWHPRGPHAGRGHGSVDSADGVDDEDPAGIPAGSQRALAVLRARVDDAAAEVGRYARISTTAPALAAPEQALVAALERLDVVEADPIAEIVSQGVDPDRALADHAFGHRLLRRSGATVLLGPGPLAVAPDLARGFPADPATRAGRAFAMQCLAVALARTHGLGGSQLAAGALVPWLADERDPATGALAAVAVRRMAWPDVALAFEEPDLRGLAGARWPYLLVLALGVAGPGGLVLRQAADPAAVRAVEESTRAAALVAAETSEGPEDILARPSVAAQADALVAAAQLTLDGLADGGWATVLGAAMGGEDDSRIGADAVIERSEAFDPLE